MKRHETVKMLKSLQSIDDELLNLNLKLNYKHQQIKLAWTLFGSVALVTVLTTYAFLCLKAYNIPLDPLTTIVQFWALMASLIISSHLIVGMIAVKHRFEIINIFIKCNPRLMHCHMLKRLSEIHFTICQVIKTYNIVFGIVILTSITVTFGWCCLFIFSVATGDINAFTRYIFIALLDVVINSMVFGIFISLIYFAEKVRSQGTLTTKYLYKLLHKIEDFRQREVVNSFIGQVQHSKLEISCGLFDLNWSFVFKVRIY